MGAYDDNNKCCLLPPSRPFSRSRFTHSVRALPAVPLICRFVCAFKYESPRCGMEQRWRRRPGRETERRASTPAGGGNAEGEKGITSTMRGKKWLECPDKNFCESKVRSSSLLTSPPTYNFPSRIWGFLFSSLVSRVAHPLPSLATRTCRSFVPTIVRSS